MYDKQYKLGTAGDVRTNSKRKFFGLLHMGILVV